jgi:FixJ family two-component response regulator
MVAVTLGPQHKIDYANAALRQAFGNKEYLRRPVAEVVEVAEHREEIQAYLDTVFQTGAQLVRYAVPMASRSSEDAPLKPAYFDALYHPLTDENDDVIGVFVEGHDVTAKLELEAMQSAPAAVAPPNLTERQRQVLAGLVAGLGNKQIAHQLGISIRTAEMHRRSLLRRLGVRTTSQLITIIAHRPDISKLAVIADGRAGGAPMPSVPPQRPESGPSRGLLLDPAAAGTARRLMEDLIDTHSALEVEMRQLDALTRQPAPPRAVFIDARWAISQASLKRRNTLRLAESFVLSRGDEITQAVMRRMAMNDSNLLKLSASHISRWPTSAALENWNEYCLASREIRKHMAAQIELERTLLIPRLEQSAAG